MVRRVRELGLSLTGRDGRVARGVGLGARRTSFGVCRLAWEDVAAMLSRAAERLP